MLIDIEKIEVGERLRSRLDPEKLRLLADDMERNGQLQEIVVAIHWGMNSRGATIVEKAVLIAGYRRLEAAKLLGWTQIRCTRQLGGDIDPDSEVDLLRAEYSENELREDFTEMERVAYGTKLKERIAATAHARMLAGKKTDFEYDPETGYKVWEDDGEEEPAFGPRPDLAQGMPPHYDGGKAGDYAARKIGMGKEKFRQGEYVLKHGTEDQHAAIDRGEASITGVYHELKPKPPQASPVPKPQERSSPSKTDPFMEKPRTQEAETIRVQREPDAPSPEEKIAVLERQLEEARARAADAESRLAREKELRQNELSHYNATIDMLKNQLASAEERISELLSAQER